MSSAHRIPYVTIEESGYLDRKRARLIAERVLKRPPTDAEIDAEKIEVKRQRALFAQRLGYF